MNAKNQPASPTAARLSGGWVAFILTVVFGSLAFWSLCAGLAYLSVYRPAALGPQALNLAPLVGRTANPDDWWTQRVLAQVYTAAVDAVTSDPQVIEQLGEPIEIDLTSEDLYRRTRTGPLNFGGEAISFDIRGSQASATVSVVSSGADNQFLHIREITVTTSDGTTIEVPPPDPPEFAPR